MIQIGSILPSFSLHDQNNQVHTKRDLLGKKTVLYFYPKDDTPGCTQEACDFTSVLQVFDNHQTEIYGVSSDSVKKHAAFATKYKLKICLLADETKVFCEECGVIKEKNMFGKKYIGISRTTFILDEKNCVRYIFENVKVKDHAEAVLEKISELF